LNGGVIITVYMKEKRRRESKKSFKVID